MRRIVLFTAERYTSFVETEIQQLREFQDESMVITDVTNPKRNDYQGTELIDFNPENSVLREHLKECFFQLVWLLLSDLFSRSTGLRYILKWRIHLSTILRCSNIEKDLYNRGILNSKDIFYCYYANEFAIVLAFAKMRGHIKGFSSRAHGRDVIEDREPVTRKSPFQAFKYSRIDAVYCVSRATQEYIQIKYPQYKKRIKVSYLGTQDNSLGPLRSSSEVYTIISVGRVRNVKRFYLIAEMLQFVELKINWIHVGDIAENDPTYSRFLKAIMAVESLENIRNSLLGYMDNDELLKFYQTNYIDALINTSEIEGLPVSIQEALSFGIPCLATDVGGASDIVNDSTGLLMPKDFSPKEGADMLSELLKSKSRDTEFRKGVREFWLKNFQAEINYPKFFDTLSTQGTFKE